MEMRGMSGELLGTIGSQDRDPAGEFTSTRPRTSRYRADSNHATGSSSPSSTPSKSVSAAAKKPPTTSPFSTISSTRPSAFLSKKLKILSALHPPADKNYTDRSPKGSVDAQIVDLIDEINAYDGLVTTSSCAGRVSVFLEGGRCVDADYGDGDGDGADAADEDVDERETLELRESMKTAPGGKGLGGRWLFVSHEPLVRARAAEERGNFKWSAVFGLAPYVHRCEKPDTSVSTSTSPTGQDDTSLPRLVRFAFEPLILHVLCADLQHAAPLLAAALNAGFRESGVQSLRSLDEKKEKDDGQSQVVGAGVMVGIRTAGLGVDSLIGIYEDRDVNVEGAGKGKEEQNCRAIVSEEYLELLVRLSEERFRANDERRERFRGELREHMRRFEGQRSEASEWEDRDARARRKRREGLQRKEELRRGKDVHEQ